MRPREPKLEKEWSLGRMKTRPPVINRNAVSLETGRSVAHVPTLRAAHSR